MRRITVHASDRLRAGLWLPDGQRLDLEHASVGIPTPAEPGGWFDLDGPTAQAVARFAGDAAAVAHALAAGAAVPAAARLGPPVPRPSKVLCIGLNYRDHAIESGLPIPERPLLFSKLPTCVIGPDDPIVLPEGSEQVDYEAELGVVIGRRVGPRAGALSREAAFAAVFGYTNVNDVSARDFQFADGQWQRGKSCDTFCPLGPYVASPDELSDPHTLRIRCRVDGVTLQDSNTREFIFDIPEVITALARHITLEPGDVIATGTPPGVGFARKPPVWLRAGAIVEVEIEGLGVLRNPVRG